MMIMMMMTTMSGAQVIRRNDVARFLCYAQLLVDDVFADYRTVWPVRASGDDESSTVIQSDRNATLLHGIADVTECGPHNALLYAG